MDLVRTLQRFFVVGTLTVSTFAAPVPVQHAQGAMRGFLVVRSQSGALLGHGEYFELAVGDHVTARLTLHFRDGSLDDDTSVFTQHNTFQFVSDHHIQRGPFFKNAVDFTLQADGNATVRTTERDGKQKVETSHFDLPPDLSNGLLPVLLLNIPHDTPGVSLGMVLPTAKGRLVKLDITPDGTQPFTPVVGDRRTANLFRIKIALGGLAGVVAPVLGKQPSDLIVWIAQGEVPMLVREVGQLSEGGPMVSLELAGASFTHTK